VLPCDVPVRIRQEKASQRRDFVRLTIAAQWNRLKRLHVDDIGRRARPRRMIAVPALPRGLNIREAGSDCVAENVVRTEFDRDGLQGVDQR
jgi:hypothetical protein